MDNKNKKATIMYNCYEPNYEGSYGIKEMKILYDREVDKSEYPDFDCWLLDMLRSGIFVISE